MLLCHSLKLHHIEKILSGWWEHRRGHNTVIHNPSIAWVIFLSHITLNAVFSLKVESPSPAQVVSLDDVSQGVMWPTCAAPPPSCHVTPVERIARMEARGQAKLSEKESHGCRRLTPTSGLQWFFQFSGVCTEQGHRLTWCYGEYVFSPWVCAAVHLFLLSDHRAQ